MNNDKRVACIVFFCASSLVVFLGISETGETAILDEKYILFIILAIFSILGFIKTFDDTDETQHEEKTVTEKQQENKKEPMVKALKQKEKPLTTDLPKKRKPKSKDFILEDNTIIVLVEKRQKRIVRGGMIYTNFVFTYSQVIKRSRIPLLTFEVSEKDSQLIKTGYFKCPTELQMIDVYETKADTIGYQGIIFYHYETKQRQVYKGKKYSVKYLYDEMEPLDESTKEFLELK